MSHLSPKPSMHLKGWAFCSRESLHSLYGSLGPLGLQDGIVGMARQEASPFRLSWRSTGRERKEKKNSSYFSSCREMASGSAPSNRWVRVQEHPSNRLHKALETDRAAAELPEKQPGTWRLGKAWRGPSLLVQPSSGFVATTSSLLAGSWDHLGPRVASS